MKKIFSPLVALASVLACTNVSAADIILNDFTDGTTQGWNKGGAAGLPLTVETEADGNKYIKLVSEGAASTHPDTKVTFQNGSGSWRGNYNLKGAKSISVRFKNMGTEPLEMHVAFGNTLADLRSRYVVTKGEIIPADGQWHVASFSLAEADVTLVSLGGHGKSNATFSPTETLGNVNTIRFSQGTLGAKTDQGHSATGIYRGWNGGGETVANLGIDDIKLSD